MTTTIILISITLCAAVYVLAYRARKERNWWAWYKRYLASGAWRHNPASGMEQHHKDVTW